MQSVGLHLLILLLCVVATVNEQIRYSILEAIRKVTFVRDIVNDLGLDVNRLVWACLVLDSGSLYVALNQNKGHLIANDKIGRETLKKNDRDTLCAKKSPCSFILVNCY